MIGESRDLSDRADALQVVSIDDGEARRIVASVFQPTQAFDDGLDDRLLGDGPENPAHAMLLRLCLKSMVFFEMAE